MLKLLLGLTLLHLLVSGSCSRTRYIYGGKTTSIWKYPFLVNLRRSGRFICGGALISPSCVLTAAHCLVDTDLNAITVHSQEQCLGYKPPPEYVRRAWYSRVSPNYTDYLDSDVALIRLKHSFDNATLVKVDYNDLTMEANFTVMGWGKIGSDGHNMYQCLQAAEVLRVPQEQCAKVYKALLNAEVTPSMFCALGENAQDACSGDSGGPVINADGRIVGIVSWGYDCGNGYPGIYTRLSNPFISYWLKRVVKNHCV